MYQAATKRGESPRERYRGTIARPERTVQTGDIEDTFSLSERPRFSDTTILRWVIRSVVKMELLFMTLLPRSGPGEAKGPRVRSGHPP